MVGSEKQEKGPRKKSEPTLPVTTFTEVKKNYTCLHCGAKHSTTVRLTKEQDSAVVTEGGSIYIINSSSPAEVECICSSCESCSFFIAKMGREELEARYRWLLSLSSLIGKHNPFEKGITKEVRW